MAFGFQILTPSLRWRKSAPRTRTNFPISLRRNQLSRRLYQLGNGCDLRAEDRRDCAGSTDLSLRDIADSKTQESAPAGQFAMYKGCGSGLHSHAHSSSGYGCLAVLLQSGQPSIKMMALLAKFGQTYLLRDQWPGHRLIIFRQYSEDLL